MKKKFFFTFRFFTKMPSDHYMDETRIILDVASEDIMEADEIRTAVQVT